MSTRFLLPIAGSAIVFALTGCASPSSAPITESYGSQPNLA